tara:strand:+ start:296 stop:763 length:468 start_codon:yes stop_codon:yes gene_type:complete
MNLSCIEANRFKNIIKFTILITFSFISCNKNSIVRNPFLPELDFEFSINLNLPLYNSLKFTGGSVLINDFGHKGILLYNLNNNIYLAWEASCPKHKPNSCSKTEIKGSLTECVCENYQYSLATGQLLNPSLDDTNQYPLINYGVRISGNNLIIYN